MFDPYSSIENKPWYLRPLIYIALISSLLLITIFVYIYVKGGEIKDEIKSRIRTKYSSGVCKPR